MAKWFQWMLCSLSIFQFFSCTTKKENPIYFSLLIYVPHCESKARSSPSVVCLVVSGILDENCPGKISLEHTESKPGMDGEERWKECWSALFCSRLLYHLSWTHPRMDVKASAATSDRSLLLTHVGQAGFMLCTCVASHMWETGFSSFCWDSVLSGNTCASVPHFPPPQGRPWSTDTLGGNNEATGCSDFPHS